MNMHTSGNANTQRLSELLSQVATIAYVTTTAVGLSRLDKDASIQADRAHNAQQGIGRLSVSRLAGAEHRVKEIKACQAQARIILIDHTTAWGDRRLLPNVNIAPLMAQWGPCKAEFDRLVARLAIDAPALIRQAEINKGNYDVEVVTEDELANSFSLEFKMEQVPDSANYQAKGLDKVIEDKLRQRFEQDMAAAYQQAQQDAIERLKAPLKNLVDRMAAYDQREQDKSKGTAQGRAGYFRDSIIENVQQMANVFSSFNLTGDPMLEEIHKQLAAFDGIEADDLRSSKDLRDDTAKRAAEILATLGDWN